MAGDIELKVQVGRIEERVSFFVDRIDSLEEKIDLHAAQSAEQAKQVSEKIDNFASTVIAKQKTQDDEIQDSRDKINELRRDRAWVIGIWGFVQLGFFAWLKLKFGA